MTKALTTRVILTGGTKTECGDYARGFRKALRAQGLSIRNKLDVVKTTSGFATVFRGKEWKKRK